MPAGGSVAAIAVAMAAGLVAKAARLSPELAAAAEMLERRRRLRALVTPLAQADAEAYTKVLEALRRKEGVADALSAAADVPRGDRRSGDRGGVARSARRPRGKRPPARRRRDGGRARRGRFPRSGRARRDQPRSSPLAHVRACLSGTRERLRVAAVIASSAQWQLGIALGIAVVAVAAVIVITIVLLARQDRQAGQDGRGGGRGRAPADSRARRHRADQRLRREDPARRPVAAKGGGREVSLAALSRQRVLGRSRWASVSWRRSWSRSCWPCSS